MKKLFCLLLCAALLCAAFPASLAEEGPAGTVAKVITKKGPLKLRASGTEKSRVLCGIPNGTCVLVTEEGEDWCRVSYQGKNGYCKAGFLTLLRSADPAMLDYRVLKEGDRGDDVLALKQRLQELGYIRGNSDLNNVYNDITSERVTLFQRQLGITGDGVASQELQAYLFSEKAPMCSQALPKARSRAPSDERRTVCGCCMGEGCECCGFKGWISY